MSNTTKIPEIAHFLDAETSAKDYCVGVPKERLIEELLQISESNEWLLDKDIEFYKGMMTGIISFLRLTGPAAYILAPLAVQELLTPLTAIIEEKNNDEDKPSFMNH